jgi:ribosome biogenesis GTPase
MYDLSFGARIIDTPGIKGFGVVDMEPSAEFRAFLNFSN